MKCSANGNGPGSQAEGWALELLEFLWAKKSLEGRACVAALDLQCLAQLVVPFGYLRAFE